MMIDNNRGYPFRQNLDEVSFIRPILVLLVVLYHSMAIHTGNWEMPEGGTIIPAYKAIGRLSYAFMLESFVFVSGYVWAYQRETRGRKDGILILCRKKAFRLLVPTIIFGLIYILLFERDNLTLLYLMEGPGHLWFLPMLFECFLISWCILFTKLPLRLLLPLLFFIGIFVPSGLPLRFSYTFYYLPFFLLGYYIYGWYDKLSKLLTYKHIVIAWAFFLISYMAMVLLRSWIITNIHQPTILGVGKSGTMAVYATVGTVALLLTSIYVTNRSKLSNLYVKLGSFCMGIYIFQQFILEFIYYYSPIPVIVPSVFLPLIGFVFALTISIVLTSLIRLSNLGKSIL